MPAQGQSHRTTVGYALTAVLRYGSKSGPVRIQPVHRCVEFIRIRIKEKNFFFIGINQSLLYIGAVLSSDWASLLALLF